jgi:ATP phosphoribosyltransferase
MNELTIVIPSGRLKNECVELLGICDYIESDSNRKLVWKVGNYKIIQAKPVDVPIYVEKGIADVGLVGKDILMENEYNVYELFDCNIGNCHLAIAQSEEKKINVIASKYVNITKDYCENNNINAEVIKLNGSVELAPILGLADAILDIVSSGNTLRANNLVEVEKVADVSVRLIANISSYQLKRNLITNLISNLKESKNVKAI